MPKNAKLEKIEKILSMMDESLTKKEFTETINKILDFLKNLKESNKNKFIEFNRSAFDLSEKLKGDNVLNISELKAELLKAFNKALKEQEDGLNFLRDKAMRIKNFKNGKDGIGKRGHPGPPGPPGSADTPEMIADKLELLKGDGRLKIEAIASLEERLKSLEERPMKGGGGTSDLGTMISLSRVVKTEVPTGLINGSNKVYTVERTISAILSFGINGQIIHSNEYSISKKTITFTTALPAGLSGTRFEIIYV